MSNDTEDLYRRPEPHNPLEATVRFGGTTYSSNEYERIASNLRKSLGPEYISSRSGPGGQKINYLEGWKATHLANEIFGFNGWSNRIMDTTVDYVDIDNGKISLGLSCIVRITLKDGTYREDVGYGSMENAKSKGAAFDKAKKEAVTDAMKRALKNLGPALGACLYDKEFLKKIKSVKVPERKFDPNLLYRAPEFRTTPPIAPIHQSHTIEQTPAQHIPVRQSLNHQMNQNAVTANNGGDSIRSEFEEEHYTFFDVDVEVNQMLMDEKENTPQNHGNQFNQEHAKTMGGLSNGNQNHYPTEHLGTHQPEQLRMGQPQKQQMGQRQTPIQDQISNPVDTQDYKQRLPQEINKQQAPLNNQTHQNIPQQQNMKPSPPLQQFGCNNNQQNQKQNQAWEKSGSGGIIRAGGDLANSANRNPIKQDPSSPPPVFQQPSIGRSLPQSSPAQQPGSKKGQFNSGMGGQQYTNNGQQQYPQPHQSHQPLPQPHPPGASISKGIKMPQIPLSNNLMNKSHSTGGDVQSIHPPPQPTPQQQAFKTIGNNHQFQRPLPKGQVNVTKNQLPFVSPILQKSNSIDMIPVHASKNNEVSPDAEIPAVQFDGRPKSSRGRSLGDGGPYSVPNRLYSMGISDSVVGVKRNGNEGDDMAKRAKVKG